MEEVGDELREVWVARKNEILKRLQEFEEVRAKGILRVFEELCFCLLTPQSSAVAAGKAISELRDRSLLLHGSASSIEAVLRKHGVRFPRNKSRYIVEARTLLDASSGGRSVLEELVFSAGKSAHEVRDELVRRVKGMGYKEASHFLRNIGFTGLAILDRHILRTLHRAGIIDRVPSTLDRSRYLEIERRFAEYARALQISGDSLDLVMWSSKTGFVYK